MSENNVFQMSRRHVLIGGAASGVLMATATLPSMASPVRVRYDLATARGLENAALYAVAVKKMQDPAINTVPQPQSWTFQSFIHGVPADMKNAAQSKGLYNGSDALNQRIDEIYGNPAARSPAAQWKAAAQACWGSCPHGSPWFVSWHRWYLFYFERICRSLSGSDTFTLPYWNYGSEPSGSLLLPTPFRDPSLALYFEARGLGFSNPEGSGAQNVPMNSGGYMARSLSAYDQALQSQPIFPSDTGYVYPNSEAFAKLGFSGRVEVLPHDCVHDSVGGWMGNVPSSAGDPVFYAHHCQIDRLWASWADVPGATYNWGDAEDPQQPTESTWTGLMSPFVDERGALVQVKNGDTVSTAAMGYQYDSLARPTALVASLALSAAAPAVAATSAASPAAVMESDGFSVSGIGASVTLNPAAPAALLAVPAGNEPAAEMKTLVLDNVHVKHHPDTPFHVFLNLPKGTAPELNGPFHVGVLATFRFDIGTGLPMPDHLAHHHAALMAEPRASFEFDVKALLAKQKAAGLWDGGAVTVTVTTLGAGGKGDVSLLTVGRVLLRP